MEEKLTVAQIAEVLNQEYGRLQLLLSQGDLEPTEFNWLEGQCTEVEKILDILNLWGGVDEL